jgi:hypothetical protein
LRNVGASFRIRGQNPGLLIDAGVTLSHQPFVTELEPTGRHCPDREGVMLVPGFNVAPQLSIQHTGIQNAAHSAKHVRLEMDSVSVQVTRDMPCTDYLRSTGSPPG